MLRMIVDRPRLWLLAWRRGRPLPRWARALLRVLDFIARAMRRENGGL